VNFRCIDLINTNTTNLLQNADSTLFKKSHRRQLSRPPLTFTATFVGFTALQTFTSLHFGTHHFHLPDRIIHCNFLVRALYKDVY